MDQDFYSNNPENQIPVYGNATDLFFSQYIEGSSNNKAISVFNGTGAGVDLSIYSITHYNNGASESSGTKYQYTFPSVTLPNGGTYTIYNTAATSEFKPSLFYSELANSSTIVVFNGDDALALKKNGTAIDVFGIIGMDPGTSWTENDGVATGITYGFKDTSVTGQTADRTLVRLPNVQSPIVNSSITYKTVTYTAGAFDPSEWGVYAQNTSKFLGWHSWNYFTAASYSQNFIQSTTDNAGKCDAAGLSWSVLVADFNSISSEEQTILKNNPSSLQIITDMHARYNYLLGYDSNLKSETNDFLDFF